MATGRQNSGTGERWQDPLAGRGTSPATNTPKGTDRKPAVGVVGIGASAGGLAALKTFFRNVADDSGLAYVIIVPLERPGAQGPHRSLLPHARSDARGPCNRRRPHRQRLGRHHRCAGNQASARRSENGELEVVVADESGGFDPAGRGTQITVRAPVFAEIGDA